MLSRLLVSRLVFSAALLQVWGAAAQPAPPAAPPVAANLALAPAVSTPPILPVSGNVRPIPGVPPTPSGTAVAGSEQAATVPEVSATSTKAYSFGDSDVSVLFLPEQIRRMKESTMEFENQGGKPATLVNVQPTLEVKQSAEVISEPSNYPVFFLSSIAYKNAGEWTIWIGAHKITSHKNNSDVVVLAVTPESATFSWKPTYSRAVLVRHQQDLFASTDQYKNKLSVVQRIRVDGDGTIVFTLRQNQSFAVGYFSIFEGYVESPKLVALQANTVAAQIQPDGGPAGVDPMDASMVSPPPGQPPMMNGGLQPPAGPPSEQPPGAAMLPASNSPPMPPNPSAPPAPPGTATMIPNEPTSPPSNATTP